MEMKNLKCAIKWVVDFAFLMTFVPADVLYCKKFLSIFMKYMIFVAIYQSEWRFLRIISLNYVWWKRLHAIPIQNFSGYDLNIIVYKYMGHLYKKCCSDLNCRVLWLVYCLVATFGNIKFYIISIKKKNCHRSLKFQMAADCSKAFAVHLPMP